MSNIDNMINAFTNEAIDVDFTEETNNVVEQPKSATRDAEEVSWRRIEGCQSFKNPVTVDEAIKAVGADYEVRKQNLVAVSPSVIEQLKSSGEEQITISRKDLITSHMATMRTDCNEILGVVGTNYGVVQNKTAFEFIDIITSGQLGGSQQAVIETAGILDGGSRMYVTAKVPQQFKLQGDKFGIDDYILFTNTHDGSGAVTATFTPIRVVCQNTLNMALHTSKNKLIFKHSLNVGKRLDWTNEINVRRAVEVMEMHKHFSKEFIETLEYLNSQKIGSNTDIDKFVASIFADDKEMELLAKANYNVDNVEEISTRKRNSINALRDTIDNGIGQDEHRGTKLWLLNGLTTYASNEMKFKSQEDKFNSIMSGNVMKKAQHAFDTLMVA